MPRPCMTSDMVSPDRRARRLSEKREKNVRRKQGKQEGGNKRKQREKRAKRKHGGAKARGLGGMWWMSLVWR